MSFRPILLVLSAVLVAACNVDSTPQSSGASAPAQAESDKTTEGEKKPQ